jgi:hypothetical protein
MYRFFVFLLLLSPIVAFCQVSITGQVKDVTTKKGVENASVILSNTSTGGRTAANGSFNLQNVKPGQYDLVVSIIGYEKYHQTITV